jgi:hypothetical protein
VQVLASSIGPLETAAPASETDKLKDLKESKTAEAKK